MYLVIINNHPRASEGLGGVLEYTLLLMCRMINLPVLLLDDSQFTSDFIHQNNEKIAGFIFSGSKKRIGKASLEDSSVMAEILLNHSDKPILGLCYGHQTIGKLNGGVLGSYPTEYGIFHGELPVTISLDEPIMKGVNHKTNNFLFWHYDFVRTIPHNFRVLSWGENRGERFIFAMKHKTLPIYGLQFHIDSQNLNTDTYNIYFNFFSMCGLKYNRKGLDVQKLASFNRVKTYDLLTLF